MCKSGGYGEILIFADKVGRWGPKNQKHADIQGVPAISTHF